jgi:hypothetical protein
VTVAGETGSAAEQHVEELAAGLRRLERELEVNRAFSTRALKQLHRTMSADLRAAEARAAAAEKKVVRWRRRTRRAERELAAITTSVTWRTGRAITAVPSKLRRRLRS